MTAAPSKSISYQYEPLLTEHHIRLLRIWRSSRRFVKGLRFTLFQVDLRTKNNYEAVSYCWGDAVRDMSIVDDVSGAKHSITKSCFETLFNLCRNSPRVLWMDQICINQENVVERNKQVAIMGEIYAGASQTVVYMGASDRHSRYVLKLANNDPEQQGRLSTTYRAEQRRDRHITCFLERGWFSRTWVLQEVLLASKTVAHIGGEEFDFFPLASVCNQHWSLPNGLMPLIRLKSGTIGQQTHRLPLTDLLQVMRYMALQQCADPRDRLFALLGMFQHPVPEQLKADYTRSLRDVYISVSRYLICQGSAELLNLATGLQGEGSLPSWVVDWRNLTEDVTQLDLIYGEYAWRPSYSADLVGQLQVRSAANDFLRLRGLRIDVVDDVGSQVHAGSDIKCDHFPEATLRLDLPLLTTDKKFGYGVQGVRKGDSICALFGLITLFALRKVSDGWNLVGTCWLEDKDHGRAFEGVEWSTYDAEKPIEPCEDFDLI